jgi:hypothetical protein
MCSHVPNKGEQMVYGFDSNVSRGNKKILKHLGLWDIKARPPPKATATPPDFHIDYSDSQIPPCEDYLFHNPEYPIEAYATCFLQNWP